MCIHWCCKHCSAPLTHSWAYERCNDYFNARSQDRELVACPNGPWLLRNAYHRHPYRGPQKCEQCKFDSRKDKKRSQSAREKANLALGHRADYNGAIDLGELKMRETIPENSQLPLEAEKLDAMNAKRESFNATHRHLTPHELEREWTKRFAASTNVGLASGGLPSMPEDAPIIRQWTGPKQGDQMSTATARATTRKPRQDKNRQSISNTQEANGGSLTWAASPHDYLDYKFNARRVSNALEALSCAKLLILYIQSKNSPLLTEDRPFPLVEGAPSRSRPDQQQLPHDIRSKPTKESNSSTVRQNEWSQYFDRSEASSNSTSNILASSSRPARTRPWDL